MAKQQSLDRYELYEQVWQFPMIKLGERYGVTRATIKWACTRMGIPLPHQGYWAHLAAGLAKAKAPLPPRSADQPKTISRADLLKQEPPNRRKGNHRQRSRWIEERKRILEEDIKRANLMMEVDGWHRAESIRRYLGELDKRVALGGTPAEGYAEWRAWTERCAMDLDYSSSRVETAPGR
ncbi:hypothetical protein RI103_14085 [Paraburkholderia sp. FT54]|uniref:hypothetical protein n=1 Tax=Paraburkholderia sp. FT54 TaxID=3074437 RepID=UPI002877A760|nr:hypothetical protein [Paraburkholderia sp. FT54]WNC88828.1 hypothetical protein RI103_14085 [Paraburkholderia sp. FT54]